MTKFLAMLAAAVLLAACPHPVSPPTRPVVAPDALQIELIPRPLYASPQLTLQGEYAQLRFHLNLRNRGGRPLEVLGLTLECLDGKGMLLSRLVLEQALLRRRLRAVGWVVMRDRQTISAAHRYRSMLRRPKGDTSIRAGEVVSLTEQVAIERPANLPAQIRCTVAHDGGEAVQRVAVERYSQRTPLRLPVQGRWWVMGGHRFDDHHGSAILGSQNFAYDLGVVGKELSTCEGDARDNDAYLASGRPVVAAAAGVVSRIHDGVGENSPVGRRPAWQAFLRRPVDLAGNHVIVKHAPGEYSAYMHLKPGLKVRPGERVERGQVLGLCGNSGNSLEPHLHFQFQDGPDPLRANGLPVRFGDFTIHWAHVRLYVSPDQPMPLPMRLAVEPGRAAGAVPYDPR